MACFLVPTAEAIVVSAIERNVAKKDDARSEAERQVGQAGGKISWKAKLSWLNGMLWGGAILLCLEHVWHGEVVFYPPFLTAMADLADTAVMLHEMSTVGVGMAALVTAVWIAMVLLADYLPAVKRVLAGTSQSAKEA